MSSRSIILHSFSVPGHNLQSVFKVEAATPIRLKVTLFVGHLDREAEMIVIATEDNTISRKVINVLAGQLGQERKNTHF